MTALDDTSRHALVLERPELPPFASFAVSYGSGPVPAVEYDEESRLTAAMVPTRRSEFARGRAAAHAALRALGFDQGPILSGSSREPLWPAGAVGAISHAGGIGVALAAPAALTDGVGVDLELHRDVPELSDHVPRPEERTWLAGLDEGERETALLELFSAKESIFKAFFPRIGSFFGFDRAVLTPTPSGFAGRLEPGLDADYPPERTFAVSRRWFGDLVLTAVVLPKTEGRPGPRNAPDIPSNELERDS